MTDGPHDDHSGCGGVPNGIREGPAKESSPCAFTHIDRGVRKASCERDRETKLGAKPGAELGRNGVVVAKCLLRLALGRRMDLVGSQSAWSIPTKRSSPGRRATVPSSTSRRRRRTSENQARLAASEALTSKLSSNTSTSDALASGSRRSAWVVTVSRSTMRVFYASWAELAGAARLRG